MADHGIWEIRLRRDEWGRLRRPQDEARPLDHLADLTRRNKRLWEEAFAALESMSTQIFTLHITCSQTRMAIEGSVASTDAKQRIIDLFVRVLDSAPPPGPFLVQDIQVTAPFRPAHQNDLERYVAKSDSNTLAMDSALERSSPQDVDVDRYPSITADKPPVVGQVFRFQVALNAEPTGPVAEPISIKNVPGDWRVLKVEVEVHSSRLLFKEGENRKTINIVRQGKTLPVSFTATVQDAGDAAPPMEIVAIFTYEHRFSGMIRQTFEVERSAEAPSGTVAPVNVMTAEAADLTVKIVRLDAAGNYLWSVDAPRGRSLGSSTREAFVNLGVSTGDFAMGLLRDCPGFAAGQHASKLRGIGEQIWKVSPEPFRALYRDLHRTLGPSFPIQIVTDEPHIAWEMMHPDDEAGIDRPDHLFMTHPIARWFVETDGRMLPTFGRGSIASFVPKYEDEESLAMALDEGRWLADNLDAVPQEATYKGFTDFWGDGMPDKPVAILHFAGHGDIDAAGIAKIKLIDGWVSCNDVHGGVKLGRSYGTFAVLNACKVGVADYQLGLASGWAASLTNRGFRGVLAPLWAVQDECASVIVRDYLGDFVGGVTIGKAMQKARAARRDVSATAYAYVVHGDVMARMDAKESA